jgi:cytochrome o ubiquinol oxidase subunit 2
MSKKYKIGFLILLGLGAVIVAGVYLSRVQIPVLQPHGTMASSEQRLILFALALSLVVVVPVFIMLFAFAYKYREGNKKGKYTPSLHSSKVAEVVWWGVPTALIFIMSIVAWRSSHQLDPYKALASNVKPLHVQVISLDWKWLFIYPDQKMASVNEFAAPQNTPIDFEITSDSVMNSFWIPSLGGQVYSMPGMSTQLHLEGNKIGSYTGRSANISGDGFAGMTFTGKIMSNHDFAIWSQQATKSPRLDQSTYDALAKPSQNNPVMYYSSPVNGLFNDVVMKYMMPGMTVPQGSTGSGNNNTQNDTGTSMPGMNMSNMNTEIN